MKIFILKKRDRKLKMCKRKCTFKFPVIGFTQFNYEGNKDIHKYFSFFRKMSISINKSLFFSPYTLIRKIIINTYFSFSLLRYNQQGGFLDNLIK